MGIKTKCCGEDLGIIKHLIVLRIWWDNDVQARVQHVKIVSLLDAIQKLVIQLCLRVGKLSVRQEKEGRCEY